MKKIISVIVIILGVIFVAIGVVAKVKESASIAIIGGADGPTSIFLAGRVGTGFSIGTILLGVIVIIIGIVIYKIIKKK